MFAPLEDEIEFRKFLPQSGFFPAYMNYTDEVESPGSFHFWVAATLISAVLQRRVYFIRRNKKIYPNLYTILVAPTGICRKTEAVMAGVDLLEGFSWLNIIADKTSPEALLEALMGNVESFDNKAGVPNLYQDSTGLIRAPEMCVFLNKSAYTQDLAGILTDLFDCRPEFIYKTRNKRTVKLKNIAIQFLGCTTPEWLAVSLPESAFGGGFMSRFIFVVRERRDRALGLQKDPNEKYEEHLKKRLELRTQLISIHSKSFGEIKMTSQASSWYNEWYFELCSNPKVVDPILLGFYERLPTNLIKIAMILATSQEKSVIDLTELETSLKVLNWVDNRAFNAFRHVDLSHLGKLKLKILEIVQLAGGSCSRRNILRKIGGQLNGLQELESIEHLMENSGEIILEQKFGAGRPTIIYHLPKFKEGE